MTIPNNRYEPPDPTAPSAGGAGSPIRPVLPERRGLRQQAGIIAVAAVAITVLLAGLGLGETATGPVPSPSGPSPAPSGAVPSGSPTPASEAPTARPTALPGLACFPASPSRPPELGLRAVDGSLEPIPGLTGPANWELSSPPTSAWPVPDGRRVLILDASTPFEVTAADGACVRYVVAEYLAVGDLGGTPTAIGPGGRSVDPPESSVALGALPAGDWVVRVEATYATGAAVGERAVTERFFRVVTGLAPGESPIMTPAVACVPLPPVAPLPQLALLAGEDAPVAGADPATVGSDIPSQATVKATFPGRLELQVIGDACATSWRLSYMNPVDGPVNEFVQENPDENPFLVSQNRIQLQGVPFGRSIVTAILSFGRERSVTAAWELTLDGPPPPSARVTGSGGASAEALPACGVSWTLASGESAFEPCPQTIVPDGTGLLAVDIGTTVRLDVPGWQITYWWITCGERSPGDGLFTSSDECSLGGWGDGSAAAGPARFLPFPGRRVVLIFVNATRDGTQIWVPYMVEVDARP